MVSTKILIVDDEREICEILKYNLQLEGFDAEIVYSAEEALTLNLSSYSLFILDVMMDKMNGFELARELKKDPATTYIPIIFCSALGGEDEHIMGLNIGADDYITKPFRTREVVTRVKSVLRRLRVAKEMVTSQLQQAVAITPTIPTKPKETSIPPQIETSSTQQHSIVAYRRLRLDHNNKQCYINDRPVNLTKTEYELLTFLLEHRNNIYTRTELLEFIWNNSESISNRTIDTNITRLRKKLGEYGRCITTRLGYGYGFQELNIQ